MLLLLILFSSPLTWIVLLEETWRIWWFFRNCFGGIGGKGFLPPICEWLCGDHCPRRVHCMIHLEELEFGWRIVIGGGFCVCGRLWGGEGFTVFILLHRVLHFCNFCGDVAYRDRSGIHWLSVATSFRNSYVYGLQLWKVDVEVLDVQRSKLEVCFWSRLTIVVLLFKLEIRNAELHVHEERNESKMTRMLPSAWIIVLLHLRVGLILYVKPKRPSRELEGLEILPPPSKGEYLEWARPSWPAAIQKWKWDGKCS